MVDKPIATLDLNWLIGTKPRPLSNQWTYLVPDAIFAEAVGADEPEQRMTQILRWIRLNEHRIYLGHAWDKIARREIRRDSPVSSSEIANQTGTARLYKHAFSGENADWNLAAIAMRSSDKYDAYEQKRRFFVDVAKYLEESKSGFVSGIRKRACSTDSDAFRAFIRNPDLAWSVASSLFQGYIRKEWESRVVEFPDRFAVARIARVFACIYCMASEGYTKGIGNTWDDAQYAFLATYSKAIHTNDRRLAQVVSLISPDTHIVTE